MISCRRQVRKVEATIIITDANKDDWYEEMVGNLLKVNLFKDDGRAQSISMKDNWVKRGHFKVVKGKDPRTVEARTGNV